MLSIGIDIGGTKILSGIVDEEGNILSLKERKTLASKGQEHVIEEVTNIIDDLLNLEKIDVIGIGSAGRVDLDKGTIYYATPNLPDWTGFKIKEIIEDRFNVPTIVDNDGNVAGIGEGWLGAGKDYSSFICLTLGTGVVSAVFINGELIRGSHWSTGEIGHMILYPQGRPCNCGQRGCLEQYCSASALYKAYNETSQNKLSSGREFFKQIEKNDVIAEQVLEQFIEDLSTAFVSLCNIYDPEVFIIGGGLIDTREYWWEPLLEKIRVNANSAVSNPIILPAQFKNKAGVLGAAKLGFDYLNE